MRNQNTEPETNESYKVCVAHSLIKCGRAKARGREKAPMHRIIK